MKQELLRKIEARAIKVGVVGLGYVGLPLAVEKARAGFVTTGFDIQEEKVAMVNQGHNYIGDVVDGDLKALVEAGMLRATNDFSFISDVDFIAICVPTPLDDHQQPDISYVRNSAEAIARYLKAGSIVVLESTTYPGTTEELLRPILEAGSGLVCGEDFYLGFSPERVDPGNKEYNTRNTPKVVGGIGQAATEVIAAMYRTVLDGDILEVSSPAVAEMEKILENTYRNVNIGLVNEMAIICDRMGISIWEVIEAAKTKPYGFQAFYPGPGLGGHCIPLDPYYLTWKAREYDYHTKFIETSGEINNYMPHYVVERAARVLNAHRKPLNGSRILVLGVAYKNDIDDYRESPALKVIDLLEAQGSLVEYFDPHVASYRHKGAVRQGLVELPVSQAAEYDLIIITTAHRALDYAGIVTHAQAILDTRNALAHISDRAKIDLL